MNDCGCKIVEVRVEVGNDYRRIEYCPLHASATLLRNALNSLVGEVRGSLGMEEAALRSLLGNTNVACLQRRVQQGQAALTAAAPNEIEEDLNRIDDRNARTDEATAAKGEPHDAG